MEPRRSTSPAPDGPPPLPVYTHLNPYAPPGMLHPPMPPHLPPPPPQQLMQPPSHMLSQLFPNLNRSQSPASMAPVHRSHFDPELTTPALPIPALLRPSSASGATVPTRVPPPTAAVRSASISSPGVVSPGTRLAGQNCVYEAKSDTDTKSLEVTPITLYVSERSTDLGTLISVNEHYISYPIRNGLIRVINQSSVNRILLRKHEQHLVTELAFFNDHTDLLLSAGTDNHIVVWRLSEDMYAQKPMTREVLKTLPCRAQRVKWHPLNSNKIAIVQDSTVFVTDLTDVHVDPTDAPVNLHAISVVCDQSQAQVNDVAFSADGNYIVSACMDGAVHVYGLHGLQIGAEGAFIRRFDPFDGAPVNSLHFFSGNYGNTASGLIIGGQGNTQLSIWNTPWESGDESDESTLVCSQTLRLMNASTMHEVVLDPTHQYVYLANRSSPNLCVIHLAASTNNLTSRRFDNITEFSLAYPILSMTVLHQTPMGSTATEEIPMQLYCIQTQAIQRYHVAPSACYVPPRSPPRSLQRETTAKESSPKIPAVQSPQASAPETELDIQITVHDFNGSEAGLSSMLATDGGNESVGRQSDDEDDDDDEDGHSEVDSLNQQSQRSQRGLPSSPRSVSSLPMPPPPEAQLRYARSSPSSSVHAFGDEVSSPHRRQASRSYEDDTAPEQAMTHFFRRMEAMQREQNEYMKDQLRIMQQQLHLQMDKTVRKHMQSVLVPAIGRIVLHTMENNFLKPVTTQVQNAFGEALDAKWKEVSETIDESMQASFEQLVDDVKLPVREAFRDSFQATIIPSFQAATQKMFEQINDTFVKGTQIKITETNENWNALQEQLQSMQRAVEGLTTRLDTLQESAAIVSAPSAEDSKFDSQCREIDGHVRAKNYEVAFQQALGAENVALVAYTCSQIDSKAVLGVRPPLLSQMIILCLVQQLGSDLQRNLPLALTWLQDSLLVMNPRDPAIAPFVQNVLQELKGTLGRVPESDRDSQFTLVHHILNSMLSYT